jgi:hypothetical protein
MKVKEKSIDGNTPDGLGSLGATGLVMVNTCCLMAGPSSFIGGP